MISLMIGALLLIQGGPEEEFLSKIPYQITFQRVEVTPNGEQTFEGIIYKLGNDWKMVTDLGDGAKEVLLVKDGKLTLVTPGEDRPLVQSGQIPRSLLDLLGLRRYSRSDSIVRNAQGLPVEIFRASGVHLVIRDYRPVKGLGWIPMRVETYLEGRQVAVLRITGVSQAEFSTSVFKLTPTEKRQVGSEALQQKLGTER